MPRQSAVDTRMPVACCVGFLASLAGAAWLLVAQDRDVVLSRSGQGLGMASKLEMSPLTHAAGQPGVYLFIQSEPLRYLTVGVEAGGRNVE